MNLRKKLAAELGKLPPGAPPIPGAPGTLASPPPRAESDPLYNLGRAVASGAQPADPRWQAKAKYGPDLSVDEPPLPADVASGVQPADASWLQKAKADDAAKKIKQTQQTKKMQKRNLAKKLAEKLEGGYADDEPDQKYDQRELTDGVKVEMEHTDNPKLSKEIAKDHLEEIPDYYTRLEHMENEAEQLKEAATVEAIVDRNEMITPQSTSGVPTTPSGTKPNAAPRVSGTKVIRPASNTILYRSKRAAYFERDDEDEPSLWKNILGGALVGVGAGGGVQGYRGWQAGREASEALDPTRQALDAAMSGKSSTEMPMEHAVDKIRYQHSPADQKRLRDAIPSESAMKWKSMFSKLPSGIGWGAAGGALAGVVRYLMQK